MFSAGPERCLAASRAGIPAVLVPGCVDMANFWGVDTVPEKYQSRNLYQWNPNVTLMRTNVEENRQMGEMIAAAANAASAPVAILLPLKGVSMLDSAGGQFWDPEADQACFDAIKENLQARHPGDRDGPQHQRSGVRRQVRRTAAGNAGSLINQEAWLSTG